TPVYVCHLSPRFTLFFFSCSRPHRLLHSFPTRRSSDLTPLCTPRRSCVCRSLDTPHGSSVREWSRRRHNAQHAAADRHLHDADRSEEHTSELQSRFDLVCRLLLEKKKTTIITTHNLVNT